MHKSKFCLLIGTTLALVAGVVSFSPSKKPVDDCLIDPSERGLAVASYTSSPKNEPWYSGTKRYKSTATAAVETYYDFDQETTVFSRINIGDTWSSNRGENVRVAVIDTGIYENHEDFSGTNISNLSKNTYLNNSSINDTHGHGTTSAAMIAAAVNNKGGTGVAPNVELVVLNAADSSGAFTVASINSALQYCIDNDVDIINMSLQGYTSSFSTTYIEDFGEYSLTVSSTGTAGSSDYSAKINACYQAGITIVAAAGNYNTSRVSYPAANDHVIAVASTGLTDANTLNKAGYSNYGDWVDVCAPGYVYTPLKSGTAEYSVTYGTSFSAPIVTGAIALYKSKYPNATPDEIERALKATCTPVDWEGGAGQINVSAFLDYEPSTYIPVTGISFNSKNYYVDKNSDGNLNEFSYTLIPSNASNKKVIFTSSDEDNFEVGNSIWLAGNEDKIVTLTVTSDDNPSVFDTCNITIGEDYYEDITASDSAGLSAQLHNLMFSTHTWYSSYDDCRNENGAYYAMDPGSSNSYLTDFYTRHDISKAWSGNSSGTWNREHVWCQSKSAGLWNDTNGSTRGGGADYHHIRPIEHDLNSTRNNNTFGLVTHKNSDTEKYSKTSSGAKAYLGGYLENGVWEPLDSVKGDIARILMYVWVHYSSAAGGTTPSNYSSYVGNLQLNDIICAGSSLSASKAMLLNWHNQDPVDNSERIRNEAAYGYQGNRNPFIDHPEYAETIFGTGKTLSSISITTSTHRTFDFGATFVGETVMANYSDDSSANVTSSATFTGYDMNQAGTQIVTVSYGGKSTTYSITVGQPQVTNLKLDKYTASLDVFSSPKTTTITATVTAQTGADKTVSWSTINNDGVISLSASTGNTITVTALKEGTATVRATAGNITKDCVFTVTDSTPTYVTSIVVSGTDELTVGGTTTLTATVSPDDATTKTVTWESSDTSVATITSGGKVTAVAPGTTNITATAKDGSGVVSNTFVLTVKAKVTVTGMSFVDLPEELNFGSYDGTYHVRVQKDFSDGTHELIESGFGAQSKLEIDTTKLGTATVKATYTGLTTLNATVKVTNHNSSQESHTVEGSTTTTTITQKTFSGDGNTIINGETFVLDSNAQYFSYEAVRGQQIGSSGKPITKATITKRNQMGVTRVVVNASGASGTNATIKVKVGGVYFTYVGVVSASSAQAYPADASSNNAALTTTATNYEFTGDSTGDIAIEYEQSSSSAIYFKSLEVTTKTTTIDSFTGVEQAEAWANYFIERTRGTNGPCLLSNETSKVSGLKDLWDDVKYEYENMTDDGKNAFCDPTTSTLIHDCLVHYQFIVSSYGSKGPLTDFVKDSNNDAPQVVSNAHRIINEVFNDSSIMIALISVVGIAAIGVFVIYKKRKEN